MESTDSMTIWMCISIIQLADFLDEKYEDYHDALLLTVEALKAQLEEQTRLCKEQVRLHVYACMPGCCKGPYW